MPETHSMTGWYDSLEAKAKDGQLTQSEAMLFCLIEIRNFSLAQAKQGLETMQAAQHTEGMLGAIDLFAGTLAEQMALPYASSAKIRESLDVWRDRQRQLTATPEDGA